MFHFYTLMPLLKQISECHCVQNLPVRIWQYTNKLYSNVKFDVKGNQFFPDQNKNPVC